MRSSLSQDTVTYLSTLQALLGASPLMCGVYILPYVMSISLASAGIGILNSKVREVSGIHNPGNGHHDNGIWLSINLEARPDWGKIILFQLIAGIGAGPNVQGPLITLQAALEGRDIAAATTMLGFMRNMFASISLTFGGVVFQNVMRDQHPQLVAELG
jgi:hypothetical protein